MRERIDRAGINAGRFNGDAIAVGLAAGGQDRDVRRAPDEDARVSAGPAEPVATLPTVTSPAKLVRPLVWMVNSNGPLIVLAKLIGWSPVLVSVVRAVSVTGPLYVCKPVVVTSLSNEVVPSGPTFRSLMPLMRAPSTVTPPRNSSVRSLAVAAGSTVMVA